MSINPRADLYYKLNDNEWTNLTGGTELSVEVGDKIQFKGDNSSYNNYKLFNTTTCQFKLEGNIMSLIYGDDFIDKTTLTGSNVFSGLFSECIGLIDASNLILPSTNLTKDCYNQMFGYCTSLVNAPELPATNLAEWCYFQMFNGCTSLVTAPKLPATTLKMYCYQGMFSNCSSLTTAPELPATNLTNWCYCWMFARCTSLVNAPELPATTLKECCYYGMFEGCSSLNYIKCLAKYMDATDCTYNWVEGVAASGTFYKDSSTNWSSKTGYDGIPSGWQVEEV